jgi:uncharacterized membrane protein
MMLGIFSFVSTEDARAEWKICNKTTHDVSVAIAYATGNKSWGSRGWYHIQANGGCQIVIKAELRSRNYYYYAYTLKSKNKLVWKGKYNFCASPKQFHLKSARKNCRDRGYSTRPFKRVAVGNKSVKTTTLTFSKQK